MRSAPRRRPDGPGVYVVMIWNGRRRDSAYFARAWAVKRIAQLARRGITAQLVEPPERQGTT